MSTKGELGKSSEQAILTGLIKQSQTNVAVRHELKTNLVAVLERELGRTLTAAEVAEATKAAKLHGL
jgi:hypothetical protein